MTTHAFSDSFDGMLLAVAMFLFAPVAYLVIATAWFTAGPAGLAVLGVLVGVPMLAGAAQHRVKAQRARHQYSDAEAAEWHAYLSQFDPSAWPALHSLATMEIWVEPESTPHREFVHY